MKLAVRGIGINNNGDKIDTKFFTPATYFYHYVLELNGINTFDLNFSTQEQQKLFFNSFQAINTSFKYQVQSASVKFHQHQLVCFYYPKNQLHHFIIQTD